MPAILSKETSTVSAVLKAIVAGDFTKMKGVSLATLALSGAWFVANQIPRRTGKRSDVPDLAVFLENDGAKRKATVNKHFIIKLIRILRILVPRFFCKETMLLITVALSLILRTYCDLWMIQNGTSIEKLVTLSSLTEQKLNSISVQSLDEILVVSILIWWAMPLLSVVNNALKYSIDELKLSFRSRLTKHLYAKYLDGFTYYWLTNLDNRISNPDQVLTQDVDRFCNAIVDLYSNLCKPILDVVLYIRFLGLALGFGGPGRVLSYLIISGFFLTKLRRPVARMTVKEQALEGQFRFVNSRLIASSEEIAFYDGAPREKDTILNVFSTLIGHLRHLLHFRIGMGLLDNIVAKYFATVVGYWSVSRPFFDPNNEKYMNFSHDQRLQIYYENGRMMYKMAEATGRIVLAGREMARLAGFTDRVASLVDTLEQVSSGRFQRTFIQETSTAPALSGAVHDENVKISVSDGGVIRFQHIHLQTPNGDTLVPDLSFQVRAGQNVLVSGPNGCGKSSLFRVLCGLWPAAAAEADGTFTAELVKPERGRLFYIPQKPYLCAGTLRDQIIYPDSHKTMKRKGIKDGDLIPYLEWVSLSYILDREGGFDSVKNWFDVLSGGEKQRIAMARLFYHRPQFAILDECTSAVSSDAEDGLYTKCRELGITLFTVSHRKSLWKHHDFVLYMDGRGAFEFKPITDDIEPFGS